MNEDDQTYEEAQLKVDRVVFQACGYDLDRYNTFMKSCKATDADVEQMLVWWMKLEQAIAHWRSQTEEQHTAVANKCRGGFMAGKFRHLMVSSAVNSIPIGSPHSIMFGLWLDSDGLDATVICGDHNLPSNPDLLPLVPAARLWVKDYDMAMGFRIVDDARPQGKPSRLHMLYACWNDK